MNGNFSLCNLLASITYSIEIQNEHKHYILLNKESTQGVNKTFSLYVLEYALIVSNLSNTMKCILL